MQPIVQWLEGIGLGQYGEAFVQADIDLSVLPDLTDAELTQLGVTLGHRKKLLRAIAALAEGQASRRESPSPAAEPPTSSAERRQVTVMFCDLVGSTELASRLDPEDLREVIGRYHARVAETVRRFDGFVAKYMGDGVLVYFGYPHAHEDDAEQAVRAGLALVDAVDELSAPERLQVRVGIATGLVVVGDMIGAGSAQEQAIIGETPNLAARLQTVADPGAVVISDSTRRQIGSLFEMQDLGPQSLKGFAEGQHAWRVLFENRALSRFEALRAASTPFVGRDEELALLDRRWQRAKAGEGSVVLISGEPGIGKSRLAQMLLERIGGEPHTRLRYFCSPHHQDSALQPFIAQIERASGFRRDDAVSERIDKLEALLAQATDDVHGSAPLIAELMSIPTTKRYLPLNLTPQKRKENTLQALLAQVGGLAARRPVLMLFEDVHWSDPTSLELLDLIIDRASSLPLLLIITFRPEFAASWAGRPHVRLLSLDRLSQSQQGAMITGVTGGKTLPKEITEQIINRTDGVPLFVEELTKAVTEGGMLTDAGDHYTVAGPISALAIPTTLHASLLARLDRLAPVREVAQIGAALGRQFSHELISAVAGMSHYQVDDGLEQLVGAELVHRHGAPPDAEYTFKHALVQDAAYSTLLRSRRHQIHSRIAATIETQFPEVAAAQPELIAHHCEQAGFTQKAIDYWLSAGRQAWSRSMSAEAVALLRRGLALISNVPDANWRAKRELDLQLALGQALIAIHGWGSEEMGGAYARARLLARTLKFQRELIFALQGEFQYHCSRADLSLALQLASEMLAQGEADNDIRTRVLAYDASGYTCKFLGQFAAARANIEQGLALYDPGHRSFYEDLLANDMLVQLLVHSTLPLACLGHVDQAVSRVQAGLAEARQLSNPHNTALALVFAWLTGWFIRSDAGVLLQLTDQSLELATEHGLGFYRIVATMFRGWSLAASRRHEEGIQLSEAGMAAFRDIGFLAWVPGCLTLLADAYRFGGRPQLSLKYLDEAKGIAEDSQALLTQAETLRLRGEVLLSTGDAAAAEASYLQAITVAQQQSAKLWELRASSSLARLWRDQGRIAAANDLLTPIYGWFTEGFDAPDLIEAKALLDELGAALGREPAV